MADTELVSLLERLVSIPSVNPKGSSDPAIAGEGRLAGFLAERLAALGFRIAWYDRESGRPNVIGSYGPANGRSLMFESHLDTVGVDGMKDPFKASVRGGRMYGRGTCDTKGPMAAALHALTPRRLEALAAAGWRIDFAGAMGEETGNIGAEKMVADGVKADRIIVLEPTELAIVQAHKGTLWWELEVTGVAAHGSNPAQGLSAILGMAEVIRGLQKQHAEDEALVSPLLGPPTLNIGSIRGGAAVNIVPDRCVIHVDRRTVPGEDPAQILKRLEWLLNELKSQRKIVSWDIRLLKEGKPFETSARSELVADVKRACEACRVAAVTTGAGWYSDAGPLSAVCSEIVVFGPGSIKQAHTVDEHIDLDSLQAGYEVIRRLLDGMAGAEPSGDR